MIIVAFSFYGVVVPISLWDELFLCGLFFPFETMPPLMAKLGAALPITMGIRALDSILIYEQGFEVLMGYLLPLVGYGVIGLGFAYLLLRKEVAG